MTDSLNLFSSYSPYVGNTKIKIADRSLLAIVRKRSIKISSLLTLQNFLHVHNLSCNLLFVSKLTSYLKCQANFFSSRREFQDLNSGKIIVSVRQSGGLYFFEDEIKLDRQAQNTCFESVLVTNENKIMLWYFRLEHLNFQYLKHLFPKLFINKDPSSFHCEICELTKHHRAFFIHNPIKPLNPFLECIMMLGDLLGLTLFQEKSDLSPL